MECGGCVRGVAKAITSVDPDAEVHADLPTRNVTIESSLPAEAFSRALQQAGFFASEV
jgi:copper chaperone